MELAFVFFLVSWLGFQFTTIRRNDRDAARQNEQFNALSAKSDESIALQLQVLAQGEETIALLNAIKDNIEHRSIKN